MTATTSKQKSNASLEDQHEEQEYTTYLFLDSNSHWPGGGVGAGYSFASGSTHRYDASWIAIGPNVNVARRGESDYGIVGLLTVRFGAFSHGGCSFDLSGGWGASSSNYVGMAEVGLPASFEYVELGYTFCRPGGVSNRPDRPGRHLASFRLHLPFDDFVSTSAPGLRDIYREWDLFVVAHQPKEISCLVAVIVVSWSTG